MDRYDIDLCDVCNTTIQAEVFNLKEAEQKQMDLKVMELFSKFMKE